MTAVKTSSTSTENSGKTKQQKGTIYHAAFVADDTQSHISNVDSYSYKQLPLGKLSVCDIEIEPITVHRLPEDIIQDSVDDYFLTTQLEGTALVSQGDTEFTQGPGDLAVMAGGLPYSIQYAEHARRLILRIPHHVFHERILKKEECDFHAQLLQGSGLVSIVTDMLKALILGAEELSETEQYTLAEAFLELAAAVIRANLEGINPQVSQQSALFRRILAYMEDHYCDCTVTPEKIADANGISTRYLHSLFQNSGTTVGKWIRERRLKATREDLLDPSMAQMRVSEISFKRGFNDSAHFSRAFRERFGISPSELRSKAADQAEQKTD